MTALNEFRHLVAEAQNFDDEYTLDQIPAYRAVLEYIKEHNECRNEFGSILLSTLKDPGDFHLFMFCMGVLKWPEVEAELRKWFEASVDPKNMRPHSFYASCLRCFDDDYEWP